MLLEVELHLLDIEHLIEYLVDIATKLNMKILLNIIRQNTIC